MTGTLTDVERDDDHFRIRFKSDAGTPVIGPIVNFLLFKVLYRKQCTWQLIRDDMVLDNKYLREILRTGTYPKRIPVEKLLIKQ